MVWVWLIRAMVVAVVPIALLENAGTIPTLHGRIATLVLVIGLTVHLLAVVRLARKRRRML